LLLGPQASEYFNKEAICYDIFVNMQTTINSRTALLGPLEEVEGVRYEIAMLSVRNPSFNV